MRPQHIDGVNEDAGAHDELASRIASIYNGPLDGFVDRRDAVVKELRAAGQRADAARVKGLRKPARMAWALDVASLDGPERIECVEAAVTATLVAQSGGGDLRARLSDLRAAVHGLADAASRAAASGGYSADRGALANAVMAVIGAPGAFEMLRAGRLVDIPEAGGLDFLTGPPPGPAASSPASVERAADRAPPEPAAREALRRADLALAAARERSASAERALRDAEANAEGAERKVLLAQQEALARQGELDRARNEAKGAAAQLLEAERSVARASARTDDR